MHWDRFANGLKQLIAKVASPESLAPEGDQAADNSILSAPHGDDGYDDEPMAPYCPDNHSVRSDDSLHLSC
jgi:hypothetical protein